MIKHQMNEAENRHPCNSENEMAQSTAVVWSELPKRGTDLGLKICK